MVIASMASWMQQDLASLVQTLSSTFYCYKVVGVVDETMWSQPSSLMTWRQTNIV